MKIFEELAVVAISVLCTSIATYMVGKALINRSFDDKFEEILDYLGSPEGQQSVAALGSVFGFGVKKGLGLQSLARGGKTFGIPNSILLPIVEKFVGKTAEKPLSSEQQSKPSEWHG